MGRWLEAFRETSAQIDTPVQLGQKGAVSPQIDLSAPKYLTARSDVAGNRPALSPVPLTTLYPVPPGDEWLADPWYALRRRVIGNTDPADIQERAAIMEYDDELSREEAERVAYNQAPYE